MKVVDILLIEDNEFDAELTIRALKKHNLANNLIHLKDGQEALDYFFPGSLTEYKGQLHPKVILLDLKMPRVNGKEVLQRLKKDARTRNIPVVILTSSKEDPDIR